MTPTGAMVIVKWRDASHHGGWSYEPGLKLSTIVSIGFVLLHDEESLVLAQSVGHDGQGVMNELAIPASCIIAIELPQVEDISAFVLPEMALIVGHKHE